MSTEKPATQRLLGSAPHNRWRLSDTAVNLVRDAVPANAVSLPATPQHLTLDVSLARAPIAPLQSLLPAWRHAGGSVVWLNWGNRPDQLNPSPPLLHVYQPTAQGAGLGTPLPGTGAPVLEAGSWSAAVVSELSIARSDIQIDKFRMSGF